MTTPGAIPRPRLLCAADGIAAVEFALLAPVFMLFMAILLDLGLAYNAKLHLVSGTTAAAQYAYTNGQSVTTASVAGFLTKVAAVATTAANLSPAPTVTVLFNNAADATNVNAYFCVTGSSPNTLTWSSTGSSSTTCGGNVSSGKFVTITLSTTTPSVFFPATVVSQIISESDAAIVRVQ